MRNRKAVSNEKYGGEAMAEQFPSPGHDQIAARAYSIWLARGDGPGSAEEDWLEAERRLQPGSKERAGRQEDENGADRAPLSIPAAAL
jgi:hypothetical protein